MVGSMPARRAAARCGKKLSSPKRSGTASAGEHSNGVGAQLVVRWSDGEGRSFAVRVQQRPSISAGVMFGISPGSVRNPPAPSAPAAVRRPSPRRCVHRWRLRSARARRSAAASAVASGIDGDDSAALQSATGAIGASTSSSMASARARARRRPGCAQALLGVARILHRHDDPQEVMTAVHRVQSEITRRAADTGMSLLPVLYGGKGRGLGAEACSLVVLLPLATALSP